MLLRCNEKSAGAANQERNQDKAVRSDTGLLERRHREVRIAPDSVRKTDIPDW
jgi:hypothetical protein